MSGHRRAAVALHGLNDEDRQWILAELPGDDREVLTQYLKELDNLGFSADVVAPGNGLSRALSNVLPFSADGTKAANEDAVNEDDPLASASAAGIHAILESEPSSLIAQVLVIRQWPWEAEFLQMLDAGRSERIGAMMSSISSVAPARQQILLQALTDRLGRNVTASSKTRQRVERRTGHHPVARLLQTFGMRVRQWKR